MKKIFEHTGLVIALLVLVLSLFVIFTSQNTYEYTVVTKDGSTYVFTTPDECSKNGHDYFVHKTPEVTCVTSGGIVEFYDVEVFSKKEVKEKP